MFLQKKSVVLPTPPVSLFFFQEIFSWYNYFFIFSSIINQWSKAKKKNPNTLESLRHNRKKIYETAKYNHICNFRSSRPEMFCRKGVPRSFAKFTEKHLCQSLFCNKVASLRPATLLKKRLWHRCFPVNFAKFLRTPFLTELLRWLLL